MNRLTIDARIRYQETDQMGVVYYSNYFIYFEMGRTEFMRAIGVPYTSMEKAGLYLVVTEASCKYFAPLRYDDQISITTWVEWCRGVRIRFGYNLFADGSDKPAAEGFTEHACIDKSGKPLRIPDWVASRIPLNEGDGTAL